MSVKAEIDGSRITVSFPYSPGNVLTAKGVAGARWNPTVKKWTYPLNIETCYQLRNAFGSELQIGTDLAGWFRIAKVKAEEITATANLDLTQECQLDRVPLLAPKLWKAMQAKGYQPPAVKFAALVGNPLIADVPGLGKTIETLGSLVEMGVTGKVLIVAPRTSLRATWEPEIHKWLSDYLGEIFVTVVDANTGSKAERQSAIMRYDKIAGMTTKGGLAFLCVNPEMVRAKRIDGKIVHHYPEFGSIQWDAVIVDESHRYLLNANPKAKSPSQWGLGLSKLNIAGPRIALSGTPMKGKPRKIWHTLRWLNPEQYSSEWAWSKQYFKTVPNPFSSTGEQITEELKPEMEAAFNRELSQVMIRRTKSELRKLNPNWAPPDKQYFEVWLPMNDRQAKQYKEMEEGTQANLNGQILMANGVLAILTRLRQFATSAGEMVGGEFHPAAPSNKIDWLLDDFIPSREGKIVIASQFSKVIDLLSRELDGPKNKINHFRLTGATKDSERQEMIKEFQKPGGPQVFLLTTTAGGVSITLDAADDLVLLDETWVPDDQEQVEDRIHRTSNTEHQVNIWYVRSLGTLEEEIAMTVEQKDESQKRVLDGRRGIEYAKKKFKAEIKGA